MTVLRTFFDIYKCNFDIFKCNFKIYKCNFEIEKKKSWNCVYILKTFLIFFFSWQLKTPNQLFGVSLFKWNISSCAQRSQHWRNCHFMWVFFRRAWAIGFVRVRRCPQDFKISSCLWGIWYCCFNWKEVSRCSNKFWQGSHYKLKQNPQFIQKSTSSKSQNSRNSHVQNRILSKILIF